MWRDSVPDAGAPLPPLQPVERSPERTVESGGEGDGLEGGQMSTCPDLWAVFLRRVRRSGDGLPGSHWCREVSAKSEVAAGSGLRAWGSGAAGAVAGFDLSLFFFLSVFLSLFQFVSHLSMGTKGSGGGAPPSSRLARRRRGLLRSCHTLIRVNTVWLKQKQKKTAVRM